MKTFPKAGNQIIQMPDIMDIYRTFLQQSIQSPGPAIINGIHLLQTMALQRC